MADVFISYKREDRSLVFKLARALQERGFTVWWDRRIETGENWLKCIKRNLDSAACVVVVWTPQSVTADRTYVSQMVNSEANEGAKREVLLPVRMQNGPYAFGHDLLQAEDLTDWEGNRDDPALARLANNISRHCGERDLPDEGELAAWLRAEDSNNADEYRQFARTFPQSRFSTEAEPRAAEIELRVADIEIAKEAATLIIEQYAAQVRKPTFTPPVAFERIEKANAVTCTRNDLFERLGKGSKAVLQAEPGGGKTVALIEWAKAYCDFGSERVGVVVRLKEIANVGGDLIAHVARLASSGHVSEAAWKALARSGVLTVFCDGWNELNYSERDAVGPILDIHARSYPHAGLVVGSRPLAPAALSGEHLLLGLQRLTYAQISAVVEERLNDQAPAALAELRQSKPLRDLVRNPFFLSAFCETRLAGATPSTREGLIREMIAVGEQRPQHAGPLGQQLGGQQGKYLRALAVTMLQNRQAELSNDDARRAINRETSALRADELLSMSVDGGVILQTLRDHHFLIEQTGVDPSFRFQHQLIGEWYAANEVRRVTTLAIHSEEARRRLDEEILDGTAWTEAIVFAVEKLQGNDQTVKATSYLILRTIGVDPEFAADLIAVAPAEVWQEIAQVVHTFIKEWQTTSKRRVLHFVLGCGKEEFSEIVWKAIETEKSGHSSQALHESRFRHPRVLGPNWRQRCAALPPEGRESLLTMLAANSGLEGAAMALEAAVTDDEPKVQAAVAQMLDFYNYEEELTVLLEKAHNQTWVEIVRTRNIDGLWEEPWRNSAIKAAHRIFAGLELGPQKINYALKLISLGERISIDLVSELVALKSEDHSNEDQLYARVAQVEGDRLSEALIEKALNGERVTYHASRYIKKDSPISQQSLLEACRQKPHHAHHNLLSPLLDDKSLATLFSELFDAHAAYRSAQSKDKKAIGDKYHVLEDTLINADRNTLAETILGLAPSGPEEIAEAGNIIMRAYRRDFGHDEREPLRPELRDRLVDLLSAWAHRLLADETSNRHALHRLAEAMAVFPSTKLLGPLRDLLAADLKTWRGEKEEFEASVKRGEQPDPGSGARLSYAYRYAQNMLSLATGRDPDIARNDEEEEDTPVSHEMADAVIEVLSEFILDYEFGREAARVIATLRPDPIVEIGNSRHFMRYDVRVARERREARRKRGAEPIGPIAKKVVDAIDYLRIEGSPKAFQHAIALSCSAVRMGCESRLSSLTELVVAHGSVETISKHLMLRLIFGHDVEGTLAEKCLDQLDGRRNEREWEYNQNWFQWEDLLVLMIFGEKPLEATMRLLTYDHRTKNHDEKKIIEALGVCGHADALQALALLRDRCVEQHAIRDWLSTVHAIGSAEAGDLLITALLELPGQRDWHDGRFLSEMIAALADKHDSLRQKLLDIARNGENATFRKIVGVFRHVHKEGFFVDLIALPGDRLQALEDTIAGALRDLCTEHQPIEGSGSAYEIVPRPICKLRARLFARACEAESGSDVCERLLEHIDEIREDYGKPAEEARHPNITIGQPWPAVAQSA
ncbi:MAG: toll/interleukin-1 receptor domain-containing protein [Nitrospirales bacterium]|nr:toll/interleukin-1 receptor domain-containing protein [Nitrospirales bacterium]